MLLNLDELTVKYSLNIKGVLHIGAHHGHENTDYSRLGITNKIFFEPAPDNFKILEQRVQDGSLLVNKALGNTNGVAEMFVERANHGQSNSLLEPGTHLTQYPHITFNESVQVEIIKLDDFDFDRSIFNFINIDVQGYELEVFKGASNTLYTVDYIMAEINRDEVYKGCGQIEEVQAFLAPYGFELVEEFWFGGTWGDGFFIKK